MDEKFVIAVSKKTGKKHTIPEHWLDHPVLGEAWEVRPEHRGGRKARTSTKAAVTAPTDDAAPVGDDDATPTSATPGDTDTPAAGGEQEN